LPMRQEGHAVCTPARSAGEPALESRVCHACRGTRLVTDPTGTVHARGSEMKMRDCCTAARTASTLLAMFPRWQHGGYRLTVAVTPRSCQHLRWSCKQRALTSQNTRADFMLNSLRLSTLASTADGAGRGEGGIKPLREVPRCRLLSPFTVRRTIRPNRSGVKKPARSGLWECGRELLRGPRYGKFFCMKSLLFFSS
jgi:hypothetical protein